MRYAADLHGYGYSWHVNTKHNNNSKVGSALQAALCREDNLLCRPVEALGFQYSGPTALGCCDSCACWTGRIGERRS